MLNLNSLVDTKHHIQIAKGINDDGDIVGLCRIFRVLRGRNCQQDQVATILAPCCAARQEKRSRPLQNESGMRSMIAKRTCNRKRSFKACICLNKLLGT